MAPADTLRAVAIAVVLKLAACAATAFSSDYRFTELPACSKANASPHFAVCDDECASFNETHAPPILLPRSSRTGASAVDTVQAVLHRAWSRTPHPTVDLFIRTGCHGAREVKHLLASVELFWPRGVGRVVLVLDAADRHLVRHIVPRGGRHAYAVFHEHAPCMQGRVFNQISYLMADHYADADIIVTIDSDCVLHSPVTPRLLFRDGRIRLPHSTAFQRDVWRPLVERFVGPGTYAWHTMVTQPVTFHRATFAAYRAWYVGSHNGSCYLDGVADALDSVDPGSMTLFCWMCQLGTFVAATGHTAEFYGFVNLDAPTQHPYQRLALHTTWELDAGADYDESARRAMVQGLCRWLGWALDGCAGVDTAYVDKYLFRYYDYDWVGVGDDLRQRVVQAYEDEVRRWAEHV